MILLLYFYYSSSMCPFIIHHYACVTRGFWGGPWLHFASYTLLPVLQVSLGPICYDSLTSINSCVPLMLRALALFSFAPLSIVALSVSPFATLPNFPSRLPLSLSLLPSVCLKCLSLLYLTQNTFQFYHRFLPSQFPLPSSSYILQPTHPRPVSRF